MKLVSGQLRTTVEKLSQTAHQKMFYLRKPSMPQSSHIWLRNKSLMIILT